MCPLFFSEFTFFFHSYRGIKWESSMGVGGRIANQRRDFGLIYFFIQFHCLIMKR